MNAEILNNSIISLFHTIHRNVNSYNSKKQKRFETMYGVR